MPYFIKKTDKGWNTVDKGGKVLGSHANKSDAIKQMVAVSLAEKIAPGGEMKASTRNMQDAIGLVDLDGTLIVDGKTNEVVYKWIDQAKKSLYIVSGRPESDRADIVAELNRLTIEYQELILSDGSISSVAMFKAATAENLLDANYDIEYVIDADSASRHAYGEAGVQHVYDPNELPGVNEMKRDIGDMETPIMETPAEESAEPTKEDLANELRELLGNVVSLKFLAHGAHWNVKGVLFSQFHEFFGDIYQDVDDIIDPLSENIRKLDFDSPFTLPQFTADTEIDATFIGGDPVDLSFAIYKAVEIVKGDVAETLPLADCLAEQGIYNFLADVQDRLSKWHWQLGAVIGDAKRDEYAVDVEEAAEGETPLSLTPAKDVNEVDSMDQAGRSVHATIERRTSFAPIEMRADGDGMTFTGYAALFNSPSEPLPFTETIKPGAFKRSLQSRNEVKLLWNHDSGTVLGSLRAGTLQLNEDERGLKVTAKLPETQAGRDAAVLLKRGDVSAMSFGFRVPEGGDSWSADGTERALNSVRLHEVSIVAFPAYSATDGQTSVRSNKSLFEKISRLAELRGVSAEELTDALFALESGEELTERQGELLTETLGKVLKVDESVPSAASVLELKKKQLDLLLKKI